MCKNKKSVEQYRVLTNFISYLFWVCLLGLSLSLLLFQQPTVQLGHELQKVEAEQDV